MKSLLHTAALVSSLFTALACDIELEDSPLTQQRRTAQAYADGTLGDRLVKEEQLLVDARVPADADSVRYALVTGTIEGTPEDLDALHRDPQGRPRHVRQVLLGGEDSARPATFDGVPAGTYTVCVSIGPPLDPKTEELLARAEAIYEEETGGPLSPEKLHAALARAKSETGHTPEPIAWSERPVRCRRVDVTARPASRIAVLEPR